MRETCLSEIRSDQPDLTLRQLAVLLIVYQTEELQTVRGVAKHLNISKTGVGRVLKRLEELEMVYRTIDGRDLRSVRLRRTAAGGMVVERLGVAMTEAAAGFGGALSEVPTNV
ncbi:MarR family transcriptional regulator [Belnapia arida]|uniref:MarR family transcriptional regulator n=1 Tax=Belnapia arida TaxID=2804533 RepID=UPI0022A6BC81|nr:MarR family transcriptional regulator [Belnapia arida]